MKLSYWEEQAWLSQVDFTLIGAGLVGLNAALRLRERFPNKHIVVVERGPLPSGASTRNAGFACFGSLSELLADAKHHSPEEIRELVAQRFEGIQYLRSLLGDKALRYTNKGGHELFLKEDQALFEACEAALETTNTLLREVFGGDAFQIQKTNPAFGQILPHQFTHQYEGELHPGFMMQALLEKVKKANILVLTGVRVDQLEESPTGVTLRAEEREWTSQQVLMTTNGFASRLLTDKQDQVKPARAQVLLTSPVATRIEGCYHLEQGYYYFRQIDGRVLLGGGRNLDIPGETTTEPGTSPLIQDRLEALLREVILPQESFEIERRWSGVMGVGPKKKPLVEQLSQRTYCGVRLGGMGVALGSQVGKRLADLVN
jgi:glycine/D-amino acid oxidase-like deaminating enzyme